MSLPFAWPSTRKTAKQPRSPHRPELASARDPDTEGRGARHETDPIRVRGEPVADEERVDARSSPLGVDRSRGSEDDPDEGSATPAYELRVELVRTSAPPTSDQALWVAIRNTTYAISFERFSAFLDEFISGAPLRRRLQRNWFVFGTLIAILAFLVGFLIGWFIS